MEKWHCTSYLKIYCFQVSSATSKNKMRSTLMSDTVKHHSGNWEGVKGPLDQWQTVLVKATCAEPTKTSSDCLCLKRRKNWKSHPEKMVGNAVEVHGTAEAGSHTHTPLVTPGQTGHWWFARAQHESCEQQQRQIILRKKNKTKQQTA